jgi:D-3-phosphoglycerate dehydrogenase
LLHIHHNVPGVLSRINEVFSAGGININGQHLQTDGEIGYVVIDVSASEEQSEGLREQLAEIPGTVRTRLLY